MGLQATGRVWGAGARLCLRREKAGSVGGEEGCQQDPGDDIQVEAHPRRACRRQRDLPTGSLVAGAGGFV